MKRTFNCKYCHKPVLTDPPASLQDSAWDHHTYFCNSECEDDWRAFQRYYASLCVVCKKEFLHHGSEILCSRECQAKYLLDSKIISPAEETEQVCRGCHKKFTYKKDPRTQPRSFCSLACMHDVDPQVKNDQIIQTEKCLLCGEKSTTFYSISDNPVELCATCYDKTKEDTTFWEIVFSAIVSSSKIVKKTWGLEVHVANHKSYCLKYLIFFKDMQFSYHHHNIKKELWHCIRGKFECVLGHGQIKGHRFLKQGQKLEIEPRCGHQLQALQNSILVEVSTTDYPEDSIRTIEGHN